LHLLRHGNGMAWKGLCDRRPEQYVLRAQGGSSEDTEGSGAHQRRRW
jgi:hypothetical protein